MKRGQKPSFFDMLNKYKYHFFLHAIVIIWGFTGILGKLIHMNAYYIVWHRTWIAVIGILIGLWFAKKDLFITSQKSALKALFIGCIVGLHWLTFYKSIELSTASLGILCLSTTTLHVTWLEPILLRKKFSIIEFLLGLLVIYGIYFASDNFTMQDFQALTYGLVSAFFAALFSVLNSKVSKETPSHQLTLYELFAAFMLVTAWLLFNNQLDSNLFSMTNSDFGLLIFLGLICTSVAFLISIEVVKHLGAFTSSLTINLEPVYTIILAVIILNEDDLLSPSFYLGSGLIIFVLFLNGYLKFYLKKRNRI